MPNPNVLAVKLLRQNAALVTLLGGDQEHIVGGDLPAGADPQKGDPWVTVCAEGGTSPSEAPIPTDRVKVICWANERNSLQARQIYDQVALQLARQNQVDLAPDGFIIISREVVRGQNYSDPDNGAACVLSFYEITSRDSIS